MKIKKKYSQSDLVEVVDLVFSYLDNNRPTIVRRLFPNADESYASEWVARKPYEFWGHLDKSNQHRLIEMAIDHYS